jgi:hypothetical protein
MPATFSNEGRILTALHELDIPARNFVDIAKSLNVQISHGRLSEALNDKTRLDDATGTKLVELLSELKIVHGRFKDVPINWAATEKLATLVVLTRVQRAALELNQQDQPIAVSKQLLENSLRANPASGLDSRVSHEQQISRLP